MSLSLLTAILELVTAIVTFLGSFFSIKQQESESQNKILQNNQNFFSGNNLNGSTVNIHQSNSINSQDDKTWRERDKEYKFISIAFMVFELFAPMVMLYLYAVGDFNSVKMVDSLRISFKLIAILNIGVLISSLKLKTWKNKTLSESSISSFGHRVSRIIWIIAILAQIFIAFPVQDLYYVYQRPLNLLILILINVMGTSMYARITFAGTMYKIFSFKNLIIHLIYWLTNISVLLYLLTNYI